MSTDLSAFHQKWRRYQGVGMTSERTRHRLIDHLVVNGVVKHPQVIEILKLIPRHQFIEEAFQSRAYEDTSLPIGFGQTISQPSTVAKMTDWLMMDRQSLGKVLEIGTGSGYQSAILSLLSDKVYSIERIAGLHQRATYLLSNLELTNVYAFLGDGFEGLIEEGPFDTIISAASPEILPVNLVEQLNEQGRLIMPIGKNRQQKLYGFLKQNKEVTSELIGDAAFVPMLSGVQS